MGKIMRKKSLLYDGLMRRLRISTQCRRQSTLYSPQFIRERNLCFSMVDVEITNLTL